MSTDYGSTANLTNCEFCGNQSVSETYQDQEFLYGSGVDQVTLTVRVPVMTCSSCGTQYTDERGEYIRHNAVCQHLGRLTPTDLREIRKSYGKSQEDWAQITGFGSASIKRWEAGSQIQNESADKYIRLLSIPEVYEKLSTATIKSSAAVAERRFRTELPPRAFKQAEIFQLRPSGRQNRMAA